MVSGKRDSRREKQKRKAKSNLYSESSIERLGEEFDLSEEIIDGAILIYRLFVGLGKGLTFSQKNSFAAASIWYATMLIDGRKLKKEDLAATVEISVRTLARRFREIEDDNDSKAVLDYVKYRIRRWREEKESRLKRLL